jgi:hypothetical protein
MAKALNYILYNKYILLIKPYKFIAIIIPYGNENVYMYIKSIANSKIWCIINDIKQRGYNMAKQKSMRTAFIRVTSENNTAEGIKTYNKNDIEQIMAEWSKSAKMTYWFIEHNADDEVSITHYHIVIKFRSPTLFDIVKNKYPYGDIEQAGSIKASIQYLIHMNDKSKVQYKWEDITTNCKDMTPYKVLTTPQEEVTLEGILEDINNGKIREYNQYIKIPITIWAKYKTRIENALLYYKERVCMDKTRNIEVIFMSGPTGIGKTTYAKIYCEQAKKSCCISSSSNDFMQDYKGEDVLVLDDARDDVLKFHDLLKAIDNHTKSTVKSRYHNKAFIGELIIITSKKPLADWYFNIPKEDKEQLYRRIQTQFKFYEDRIEIFTYDDISKKYIYQGKSINYIKMKSREKMTTALNVLKAMGVDIEKATEIEQKVKTMTDEELDKIMLEQTDEPTPFDTTIDMILGGGEKKE